MPGTQDGKHAHEGSTHENFNTPHQLRRTRARTHRPGRRRSRSRRFKRKNHHRLRRIRIDVGPDRGRAQDRHRQESRLRPGRHDRPCDLARPHGLRPPAQGRLRRYRTPRARRPQFQRRRSRGRRRPRAQGQNSPLRRRPYGRHIPGLRRRESHRDSHFRRHRNLRHGPLRRRRRPGRKGIDFVCHVIGFDLQEDEKKGLQCLADKTGGMYLDAKDANTPARFLNKAVETVVVPETHLILAARSAAGDLLSGVNFSIYGPAASETPLHSGSGGKFRQKLEPGAYTVTAKFGELQAEGQVEVPGGVTTNFELQFQATGLRANAVLVEGGEPIDKNLSWRLYQNPPGSESRPGIGYSYDAQPTFHLSPGTYYLAATRGNATAEREVEVIGGQATEVTIVLGSGFLVATASMTEQSEPLAKGLGWKVYSQPDAEGDRSQVGYSYDAKPRFVLPSGTYLLQVKVGNSGTQQRSHRHRRRNYRGRARLRRGNPRGLRGDGRGQPRSNRQGSHGLGALDGTPNAEGEREASRLLLRCQQPKFKVPSGTYFLSEATRGAAVTAARKSPSIAGQVHPGSNQSATPVSGRAERPHGRKSSTEPVDEGSRLDGSRPEPTVKANASPGHLRLRCEAPGSLLPWGRQVSSSRSSARPPSTREGDRRSLPATFTGRQDGSQRRRRPSQTSRQRHRPGMDRLPHRQRGQARPGDLQLQ